MSLSQDHLRAIDQLRQRLFQLSSSIQSVKVDLERNEPLPTPASLASSAQILSHNLTQFNQIFASHRQFLTAAHAYPLPTFPGQTQEMLLGQLIKKKLEPRAQDWVDDYTKPEDDGEKKPLKTGDVKELWNWAGPTSNDIVRELMMNDAFEDDFTFAEREAGIDNVVTGLKRKLGEDSDDEDDDDEEGGDEDKMDEDVMPGKEAPSEPGIDPRAPPMMLDKVLAFATTGFLPAGHA